MTKNNLLKSNKNYVLLIICGILVIANVFITIGGAGSGVEVASLQKQEAVLSAQKDELQNELVKSLSLNDLQEKSQSLGFTKPQAEVYLSGAAPVANIIP